MKTAALLVDLLLEADEPGVDIDPDDIDPEYYLHQHIAQIDRENTEGTLNARTALTAHNFWHKTAKYTDGLRAISVRRNGATKTWKTRPGEFRIPVKAGLKSCGEVTHTSLVATQSLYDANQFVATGADFVISDTDPNNRK